jgi:methylglyoxal synthase
MIESLQKPTIAFLASPATRREGGTAHKFVHDNLPRLREYRIVTTAGVFQDLFAGRSDLEVENYPPHDQGGLVMIGADIADEHCKCLVHFTDPARQPNPLSSAVLEQAIWSNIPSIINNRSGDLWINGLSGVINQGEETLALIAHSEAGGRNPKSEMVKFAKAFVPELLGFKRILCTGNTGQALHEAVPELRPKLYREFKSGMRGGDFQIAREIIRGNCQHIIFLINSGWAQPHSNAVTTFVYTSRHYPVNEIFNPQDAWRWGGYLRQERQR